MSWLHDRSRVPRRLSDASDGAGDLRPRIDQRDTVRIPARLVRRTGATRQVTILNWSDDGVGIDGAAGIGIGEHVLLITRDSRAREVQIRWVVGNHAGARFVGRRTEALVECERASADAGEIQ